MDQFFDRETLLTLVSMVASWVSFFAVVLPLVALDQNRSHYLASVPRKRLPIFD